MGPPRNLRLLKSAASARPSPPPELSNAIDRSKTPGLEPAKRAGRGHIFPAFRGSRRQPKDFPKQLYLTTAATEHGPGAKEYRLGEIMRHRVHGKRAIGARQGGSGPRTEELGTHTADGNTEGMGSRTENGVTRTEGEMGHEGLQAREVGMGSRWGEREHGRGAGHKEGKSGL